MGAFDSAKSHLWRPIARVLSWGYGRIQGGEVSLSPEEWRNSKLTFAQSGEDQLILSWLRAGGITRPGFYVDVGAYHPYRFSHTLLLHRMGWSGINIDVGPEIIESFRAARPGDVSVCAAISDGAKRVRYYRFPSGTTNQLFPEDSEPVRSVLGETPIGSDPIVTQTLTEVLTQHAGGRDFDLLRVGCSGNGLNILRGLDWDRWHPMVLSIESSNPAERRQVVEFLRTKGYLLASLAIFSLIFTRHCPGVPLYENVALFTLS